ncbi:Ankyrin repeat-containing protein [Tenacibaculum sp. MAR_2009_124]|uniref:ankyrin repeat domain-containing protein n=1 Tax=Tenacibaculum sp. MAR_2009_124 TaxID=1250059 RepID=UPI000898BCA9|nr:ankyrin repeat domain-containing protein [Tenacibaculum sp. MAR_2009_124]SEC66425.1 Ankyrin repeat-containing protein [Tenacibaculum sp. MAR_2009_124]
MTEQEKMFIESCLEGNLRSIKMCVKHGVNIHVQNNWSIDIVARKGYSKIVKYFLENGISNKEATEKKVLAYCCHNGDYDTVKYLIERSDEYKVDHSSLQWAASKGDQLIVEMLLAYINDLSGLFCSAAQSGNVNLMQFLIDNDLQNLDHSAERAVYWGAEKNKWNCVDILLNNEIGTLDNLGSYKDKYFDWKQKIKQV